MLLSLVSVLFATIESAKAYSSGAPNEACTTFYPKHDFVVPMSSPAPFRLTLSENSIHSGDELEVSLSRTGRLNFMGFMINAQEVSTKTVVGTFYLNTLNSRTPVTEAQFLNCFTKNNTVTHSDSSPKTSVRLTWRAPNVEEMKVIVFYYTVVSSKRMFWVKKASLEIVVSPKPNILPRSTAEAEAENGKWDTPLYCGSAYGCFGIPSGCIDTENCQMLVKYKSENETGKLTISVGGNIKSNQYLAVGISTDSKMNEDLILVCSHDKAFLAWTQKKTAIKLVNDRMVKVINTISSESFVLCKYQMNQEINFKVFISDKKVQKFDFNKTSYYMLLSMGPLTNDRNGLSKHYLKEISPFVVDFKKNIIVQPDKSKRVLVQLHGVCMTIAWIGCASCGTMIARYFKNTWTQSKLLGKDVWFVVHQGLMGTAVFLTVLGFIIIASGFGFLPYEYKFIQKNPHPALGMTAIILCLIQFILGAIRPDRSNENRYIFNFVHWFLGNATYILATVTLILSVDLELAKLPITVTWVLLAFFLFHALVHLILSIQAHMIDEDTNKIADSSGNVRDKPGDQVGSGFRKFIFGLYALFAICVVIFIIVRVSMKGSIRKLIKSKINFGSSSSAENSSEEFL